MRRGAHAFYNALRGRHTLNHCPPALGPQLGRSAAERAPPSILLPPPLPARTDLNGVPPPRFDGRFAYTRSKLCNIYFAYELARRLQAQGSKVTVNAYDPVGVAHAHAFVRACMCACVYIPTQVCVLWASADRLAVYMCSGMCASNHTRLTNAVAAAAAAAAGLLPRYRVLPRHAGHRAQHLRRRRPNLHAPHALPPAPQVRRGRGGRRWARAVYTYMSMRRWARAV